jgi:rhodanese-related sulfurtransferase
MSIFSKPILAIVMIVFFLAGCNVTTNDTNEALEDGPFIKNISNEEAKSLIENEPKLIILDVRTKEEYKTGRLRNSILIPLSELESRLGELNKNAPILVYCRSGNRSVTASKILLNNGFNRIYNLRGGIIEWDGDIIT